jgi:hypothetical protein
VTEVELLKSGSPRRRSGTSAVGDDEPSDLISANIELLKMNKPTQKAVGVELSKSIILYD